MALNCCLCMTVLPTDKRRRKRLHGDSCREVKQQLQAIANVSLENIVETKDPKAYLCYDCDRQISSIITLEAKVASLKSAVNGKLSLLHSVLGTSLQLLRKRSLSGENQQAQLPVKRARLSQCSHSLKSDHYERMLMRARIIIFMLRKFTLHPLKFQLSVQEIPGPGCTNSICELYQTLSR